MKIPKQSCITERFSTSLNRLGLKTRGFTLIELLVVLVIIAILAALIFPVLSQAKEKSKQAVCMGNMREIGMNMFAYAVDHNGYFPPGSYDSATGRKFWPETVAEQMGMPDPKSVYTDQKSIFQCPSYPSKSDYQPSGVGCAYMINLSVSSCPPASIPGGPFLKIEDQSKTLLLTEGTGVTLWVYAATSRDPLAFSPRHSEGLNIVFVDGHAEYHKGTILPEEVISLGLLDE